MGRAQGTGVGLQRLGVPEVAPGSGDEPAQRIRRRGGVCRGGGAGTEAGGFAGATRGLGAAEGGGGAQPAQGEERPVGGGDGGMACGAVCSAGTSRNGPFWGAPSRRRVCRVWTLTRSRCQMARAGRQQAPCRRDTRRVRAAGGAGCRAVYRERRLF